MAKKRVLLVGSGGIGTITALNLESSGECEVTAVLRSNYQTVKEKGFRIQSIDHGDIEGWRPTEVRNTIPNITTESLPPYDWIIITTKNTPDIPPTLSSLISPAITPSHTLVILIQNGLNIHLPLLSAFPTNPLLSGISRMGANEPSPGFIVEDDPDRLSVGVFRNADLSAEMEISHAMEFVRIYNSTGKAVASYDEDVVGARWRKLVYNAVWNPVCALTGLDTGRLRIVGDVYDPLSPVELLIKPAMEEVRAVAKAVAGVDLPEEVVMGTVEAEDVEIWCQPSMLQDVKKGRFMEVENILGEVVRSASEKGVECRMLKTLYALCKARQWGTMEAQGFVDKEKLARRRRERMAGS